MEYTEADIIVTRDDRQTAVWNCHYIKPYKQTVFGHTRRCDEAMQFR